MTIGETIGVIIGGISLGLNIFFIIREITSRSSYMRLRSYKAQSQSVCNSLEKLRRDIAFNKKDIGQVEAALEMIQKNINSLNGEIQRL